MEERRSFERFQAKEDDIRKMDERRKFSRVPTDLKAQYCLKEEEEWKGCLVIDFSQIGMGIKFLTREKIIVGSIK